MAHRPCSDFYCIWIPRLAWKLNVSVGWLQSVPYHVFPFIFPLQKVSYIILFISINIWTILIRKTPLPLPPVVSH